MGYTLHADIDDMSRAEAEAVLWAIVEMHGAKLVKDVVARHAEISAPTSASTGTDENLASRGR